MAALALSGVKKFPLGNKFLCIGRVNAGTATSGADHIAKEVTGMVDIEFASVQPIATNDLATQTVVKPNSVTTAGAEGSSPGDVAVDFASNDPYYFLLIGRGSRRPGVNRRG